MPRTIGSKDKQKRKRKSLIAGISAIGIAGSGYGLGRYAANKPASNAFDKERLRIRKLDNTTKTKLLKDQYERHIKVTEGVIKDLKRDSETMINPENKKRFKYMSENQAQNFYNNVRNDADRIKKMEVMSTKDSRKRAVEAATKISNKVKNKYGLIGLGLGGAIGAGILINNKRNKDK
jgi:hypothetical protein